MPIDLAAGRSSGHALGYAIECTEPGLGAAVALVSTLTAAYLAVIERLLEASASEDARDDDPYLARQLKRRALELGGLDPHLVEVTVGPYAYRLREALP